MRYGFGMSALYSLVRLQIRIYTLAISGCILRLLTCIEVISWACLWSEESCDVVIASTLLNVSYHCSRLKALCMV